MSLNKYSRNLWALQVVYDIKPGFNWFAEVQLINNQIKCVKTLTCDKFTDNTNLKDSGRQQLSKQ